MGSRPSVAVVDTSLPRRLASETVRSTPLTRTSPPAGAMSARTGRGRRRSADRKPRMLLMGLSTEREPDRFPRSLIDSAGCRYDGRRLDEPRQHDHASGRGDERFGPQPFQRLFQMADVGRP